MNQLQLSAMLDVLGRAVAWDTSVEGDEAPLALWLSERLARLKPTELMTGVAPRRHGKPTHWVFARWGVGHRLLNVHIDTVPRGTGWSGDPLQLRRAGDDLVGLGASDNKGALAAALVAIEESSRNDVAVLFSGDEECDSESVRDFLTRRGVGELRQAIVAEPTSCLPGGSHPGVIYLDLHAYGDGGHSSLADELASPMLELAKSAVALSAAELCTGDRSAAFNVANMRGGGPHNVVPHHCILSVSLRPPSGTDVGAVLRRIEKVLQEKTPRVKLSVELVQPPFATIDSGVFEQAVGRQTSLIELPFWTEAALLAEQGLNTIVLGPGEIEAAHKPDESVSCQQLFTAFGVYQRFLDGADGR